MKSEVINTKTPVSRVGNKSAILHILYALFPLHYGRFIDVFGGSGSVLLGKPTIDAFEVYNDFDRNLVNLFHCMKERTMATIRELGFCNLNSREDFIAIRKFFDHEVFDDRFLTEELMLTEIMLPPLEAAELKEIRLRIKHHLHLPSRGEGLPLHLRAALPNPQKENTPYRGCRADNRRRV